MVVVEAVDELLAVHVALVLRAPSQSAMCASTMKYFSPSLVYTGPPRPVPGSSSASWVTPDARAIGRPRPPAAVSHFETAGRSRRAEPAPTMVRTSRAGPTVGRDATARLEVVRVTDLPRPTGAASGARPGCRSTRPAAARPAGAGLLGAQPALRRLAGGGRAGVHRRAGDRTRCSTECGAEVLGRLHGTLVNEPVGLMITDAEGLVLARWCGGPGHDRVAGPGAPGARASTSASGRRHQRPRAGAGRPGAALVRADEHYVAAAAPLHLRRGAGARPAVGRAGRQHQPDHLVRRLLRPAAGAGPVRRRQHQRADARALPAGSRPRPLPRGEVFHVFADRLPGAGPTPARPAALAGRGRRRPGGGGRRPAAGGGGGARRRQVRGGRPRPARRHGAGSGCWSPGRRRPPTSTRGWRCGRRSSTARDTCVVVSGADVLPAWAADELAAVLGTAPAGPVRPIVLTAPSLAAVPASLAALVDSVVEVPPLRHRAEDVEPLARPFAREHRHRDVAVHPAGAAGAGRPLLAGERRASCAPSSREAVARTDVVDVHHLPPSVLSSGARAAHPAGAAGAGRDPALPHPAGRHRGPGGRRARAVPRDPVPQDRPVRAPGARPGAGRAGLVRRPRRARSAAARSPAPGGPCRSTAASRSAQLPGDRDVGEVLGEQLGVRPGITVSALATMNDLERRCRSCSSARPHRLGAVAGVDVAPQVPPAQPRVGVERGERGVVARRP